MKKSFLQRIRHRLYWLRLRPIPVFVFHQVSDVFEPDTMWECDWTQTEVFKRNVSVLMKKYQFISLEEVQRHLARDKWRFRNYAALTADDGWASLQSILPWLVEQKIPVTLFLNPSCLDGMHWNSRETDKLLTKQEVLDIIVKDSPYVSVASHGWTHKNSREMTMGEFEESVNNSEAVLAQFPRKVPFYAFASGRYTLKQVDYLKSHGLTPVFVDGTMNEKDSAVIHRYCLDAEGFGKLDKRD